MTRTELETAWITICQSAKDGDFTLSRKKGEWKVQLATMTDASLAHRIISYMAKSEDTEDENWHPDMFE